MSQKNNSVIIRNLRYTIFYMKANILQDFHICRSVPLKMSATIQSLGPLEPSAPYLHPLKTSENRNAF